jgi:hypothetical protein
VYLVSVLVLLVYLVSISVTGENSAHTYLLPGEHARAQMLLRPGGGCGEPGGGGGCVCQSGLPSVARFLVPLLRRAAASLTATEIQALHGG